jgi:hypothetical protein
MAMERRHAHSYLTSQLGDGEGRAVALPDCRDGVSDGAGGAIVADEAAQGPAEGRGEEAIVQLADEHGAEHSGVHRRVREGQIAGESVDERGRRTFDLERPRLGFVVGRRTELVIETPERLVVHAEEQSEVRGLHDARYSGQIVTH